MERGGTAGHVLLVDDEQAVLRALTKVLETNGFVVSPCSSGQQAVAQVTSREFDAIVTDVAMPDMTGLELLREIRTHDLDIPVLLMTGFPDVETAANAVRFGAFRYLFKPVSTSDLIDAVAAARRLRRLAVARRALMTSLGQSDAAPADLAGLEAHFDRALDTLYVVCQPILSCQSRSVYGYEALMRTREPAFPHPGALLNAAETLSRVQELEHAVWERAADSMKHCAADVVLFLNLHPSSLSDPELTNAHSTLAQLAQRIVLEVTERNSLLGISDLEERVRSLRELGFRIAIDDLGAGYAGLSSFAQLEPEVVKIDMSLVRGIHENFVRQQLVRSVVNLCRDMDVRVVAEGVETAAERDTLVRLGCEYLQGYLFARPAPPFPEASW